MSMRVLIIGGTRFIGPHVVKQLMVRGYEITLFNRGKSVAAAGALPLPADIHVIHGDRRALSTELQAKLRAAEPEVVIDLVCVTERDAASVLDVFAPVARRYVLVSSCDVYRAYGILIGKEEGEPALEPTPLTEDSPVRRRLYPYRGEEARAADDPQRILDDYDKIPSERLVLHHAQLEGVVLRLPMVYGPGDYQHRLHSYLTQMDGGAEEIVLARSLAAWRDCRGYVADVAQGIVLAAVLDEAAGRVYNIAEEDSGTQKEWVERIAHAAGWGGALKEVDEGELPAEERPDFNTAQHLTVDSRRIRTELGYCETAAPEEALHAAVEWERVRG